MSLLEYRAVDDRGRIVRGRLEVDTPEMADGMLRARGLYILGAQQVEVQPVRPGSPAVVARLTRALAGLLESGLPLPRALSSISRTAGEHEATMLLDVRHRLEKGATFAEALQPHAGFFPPLFMGVVRAGERSGTLAPSLSRLASHIETELEIRRKLTSAAVYPLLLLLSGAVTVGILLLWILPRFADLLSDAGAALPMSTAFLLRFSTLLVRYSPIGASVLLLLLAGFAWISTTEEGRRSMYRLLYAAPWVGPFRRNRVGARVARLLSVLLRGGAPALEAIRITAESLSDPVARGGLMDIHGRVREGEGLAAAVASSTLLPPVLLELSRFGEESARLPDFLERAAEALESGGQETMRRLTVIAEPVMVVGFGVIVGFVALSLMQAVYGLDAGLRR